PPSLCPSVSPLLLLSTRAQTPANSPPWHRIFSDRKTTRISQRIARRRSPLVRYVVLGAAGQLGRDLGPRLGGDVAPLTRAQIDLARPETVRPAIEGLRPEVVINCAAYNQVDRAESEPEVAFAVNVWGVRVLASVCRDLGCTLVHFSTDYVFGLD